MMYLMWWIPIKIEEASIHVKGSRLYRFVTLPLQLALE
jgi:hypothetical protein